MPKFVFLVTDIALLLLLLALVAYVWHVRRSPELRATWRPVFRDAAAMSALVMLTLFLLVAALDSLHFRPLLPAAEGAAADAPAAHSTRTYSVLDQLLRRPMEGTERTYSAPLSYRSYSKETLEIDGKAVREFPRLAYGGAHLKDPASDWLPDLLRRSAAPAACWRRCCSGPPSRRCAPVSPALPSARARGRSGAGKPRCRCAPC